MKFSLLALTVLLVLGNGIIYHRSFVDGFSFPEDSASSGFRGGSNHLGQNYGAGYQNEFYPGNVIQNQIRPNIPNFYLNGPINIQNWNPYQAQISFWQQNLDQQLYSLPAANQDSNTIIGLNELFYIATASIDSLHYLLSLKMCFVYTGLKTIKTTNLKETYNRLKNIIEDAKKIIQPLLSGFYLTENEKESIFVSLNKFDDYFLFIGYLIEEFGGISDIFYNHDETDETRNEKCSKFFNFFGYRENENTHKNTIAINLGMEKIKESKMKLNNIKDEVYLVMDILEKKLSTQ
ncbi:hypothetical protein AYI68_g6651 [Smittium mucronatum]|uniref:Uncharacterized protein n=1 Tax=Smittium mucronatum TaxID=133383 RepID=A0A1R0GQW0_9FUNG|nr:hypothetical protein AYI68_g6651 [Smittium mucronatum]